MTVRLEQAAVAYEVNTAHIPTEPVDLAHVVTVPLPPTLQPPEPYPTPVAALLHRAHHHLFTDGWCCGALVDEDGARCLVGAIRAEAGGDSGRADPKGCDPQTLMTRHNWARWRCEAGDADGAARALAELLADVVRVLGPNHPRVASARQELRWRETVAGEPEG
ncbi:DUF6197 family protein [Streptomyces goshikiensis]